MKIEKAIIEDLPEILKLQKMAFREEAELYNDFTIEPLTQTVEGIRVEFKKKIFLKAVIDGKIVGSVRSNIDGDTCFINKLIVHTAYRNRGIGSKLMNKIEKINKNAQLFSLYTGHKSKRNIYLYEKLGYVKTNEMKSIDSVHLVTMYKTTKNDNLR